MEDRKKCAVYARMARCDDPADMDAQVDMLLKLADSKGLEVVKVYREVAPGIGDVKDRPAFAELLEKVAGGAYDAVVVRDVSRLTRGGAVNSEAILDSFVLGKATLVTPERDYVPPSKYDAKLLGLCV